MNIRPSAFIGVANQVIGSTIYGPGGLIKTTARTATSASLLLARLTRGGVTTPPTARFLTRIAWRIATEMIIAGATVEYGIDAIRDFRNKP